MTSLTDRVKAKLAFDEHRAILELPLGLSAVNPDDIGNQLLRQIKREHTRLQPLLTQLLACVEALEQNQVDKKDFLQTLKKINGAISCGDRWGTASLTRLVIEQLEKLQEMLQALTALEESLKEQMG